MVDPKFVEQAAEGFDDEALVKMMLGQLVRTFPKFEDAPKRIREARDQMIAIVGASWGLHAFASQTARLTQHGEQTADGLTFEMEPDDAIDTVNHLIRDARDVLKRAERA